ncbi:hypothetical protein QJS10_CPB22g01487 [Acorus calamus]|uniref:Reverse transcriptase zinc-binding domain-containing protein n=1 Tax=Acorus calamus TaxID=4465 RepID=A0AAV9C2Y6_ACOCL|nr:hypothetical protein QJS10_CPB22g01487 [Acorus calamus]
MDGSSDGFMLELSLLGGHLFGPSRVSNWSDIPVTSFKRLYSSLTRGHSRNKWGTNRSDSPVECGLRREAPESVDHLFSQCRVTSAFWRKVCSATSLAPFHSLQEMWEANEALRIRSASRHAWHVSSLIIPAGTWVI